MRVGIIAPTNMLQSCCSLGRAQYCIPYLIAKDKSYQDYYKRLIKRSGQVIIMDIRKPGWKREPEDLDIVKEALQYVHPDWIVLPSVMYDPEKSFRTACDFRQNLNSGTQLLGCLEGTTEEEVTACRRVYFKKAFISKFAVPSHILPFYKHKEYLYIENHTRIEELEGLSGTLVTSLPVRLGLDGRLVSDPLPSPPSLTFNEEEKYPEIVRRNILETLDFYDEDR